MRKCGGTIVVGLSDASKISAVAEPLFLAFNAKVTFYPCMTPDVFLVWPKSPSTCRCSRSLWLVDVA